MTQDTGFVYFLWDGSAIKIGQSRNPEARRGTLQTGNRHVLRVVASTKVADPKWVEAGLHERFASKRVESRSREWFWLSTDEAQAVALELDKNADLTVRTIWGIDDAPEVVDVIRITPRDISVDRQRPILEPEQATRPEGEVLPPAPAREKRLVALEDVRDPRTMED